MGFVVMGRRHQRFFVIDGCDGSGKSSLCRGIAAELERRQHSYNVVLSREPGGTQVGELIRGLLCDPEYTAEPLSAESELALFCAARAQHVSRIIGPALAKPEQVVICDRYTDSTRVYQGLLQGLSSEDVEWMIQWTTKGLSPRLTFVLDGKAQVFRERVFGERRGERMSSYDQFALETYVKIVAEFRRIADADPVHYHLLRSDCRSMHELVDEAAGVIMNILSAADRGVVTA